MKYLLAHDLGTSGDKATLFSQDGELVASRVRSYPVYYSGKNQAQQDAEDWWQAFRLSTGELLSASGVDPADIAAVSFSGQMMGCLCVDRQGAPLRPAIIWADSRASEQSRKIDENISQWDFYNITGHRNMPYYGVQKLMWVRDKEPEIYRNTYKVLNAKDYIVHKLTGVFCTDYSDANSMTCFDINTLSWSERLVGISGIEPEKLPEAHPSTYVAGGVTREAADLTGLAPGTPVVIGGGDGVIASVGAGSVLPGRTYSCMGTSAWVTTCTDKPIYDSQMRTVTWVHPSPGMYAPNGTMQAAGAAFSWLRDTVCAGLAEEAARRGVSAYTLMDELAQASPPGSNGLVFLPYLMGERAPRWDPDLKGAFLGLSVSTSLGDMIRGVLEGVTMNLAVIMDCLRQHVDIHKLVLVGGGAKGQVWRQIMADIYGADILVPTVLEEAGSMGACVTAGVGIGMYGSFTKIDDFLEIASVCRPNAQAHGAYSQIRPVFEQCFQAVSGLKLTGG